MRENQVKHSMLHINMMPVMFNRWQILVAPAWMSRTFKLLLLPRLWGLTIISFIGKSGGEIFHDMMIRHDVKHICTEVSRVSF